MDITDEQWQTMLGAVGNRAGALQATAVRLGLIEAPVRAEPEPVDREVQTTYPAEANVAVEGADADVEDENDTSAAEPEEEEETDA